MKRFIVFIFLTILTIFIISSIVYGGKKALDRKDFLNNSKTFMYQIQNIDNNSSIRALAKTNYPLLIIEPNFTVKGSENFNVGSMVKKLRKRADGKRRLVLAYIDIGEAEDYRTYWSADWIAPTENQRGNPDFLITPDPDGWSGNYPVAYWDHKWKEVWLGNSGIIKKLAEAGFDGVYLDWIEAYDDPSVVQAARQARVDPVWQMVTFIKEIRDEARKKTKNFLIVAQNAPYLIDEDIRYKKIIDGLGVEDTWFSGQADASWSNPKGGDIPNRYSGDYSTKSLIKQFKKYTGAGIPVFTIDYCLKKANANKVYKEAKKNGLRALVTRVELSRITTTPASQVH